MENEQRRLTATKAAQRVGIAYSTMREHIRLGRVSAERKGRSLLIEEEELRRKYPDAFSADESADRDAKGTDDSAIVKPDSADGSGDSAIGGIESADPVDVGVERIERDGRDIEVEVLQVKLESRERENETLRSDVDHLRGLTTQQAESIQNLTEEMKGLTVALHRAQEHLQIEAATHPAEEPDEREERARQRGWFGRMFRRRRMVRVGQT
jgi:hypothetical protein